MGGGMANRDGFPFMDNRQCGPFRHHSLHVFNGGAFAMVPALRHWLSATYKMLPIGNILTHQHGWPSPANEERPFPRPEKLEKQRRFWRNSGFAL
jgi:hypothetical protein